MQCLLWSPFLGFPFVPPAIFAKDNTRVVRIRITRRRWQSAVSQGQMNVSTYCLLSVRVRWMSVRVRMVTACFVSFQLGLGGCEHLLSAVSQGQEGISMSCQLSVRVRMKSAHNVSCHSGWEGCKNIMSAVSQGKEGVTVTLLAFTLSCQSGSGGCQQILSAVSQGKEGIGKVPELPFSS